MDSLIKTWKTSRKLYRDYFDQYNLDQLNTTPLGFKNNLIWNIGHIIAAQQSLVYRLSNLPMNISDELFDRYKPGTYPDYPVSETEAEELKTLLFSSAEQAEEDLANNLFQTFKERMTATGFHLQTLEDAFQFNNYHEGLHLGYMKSIEKFI